MDTSHTTCRRTKAQEGEVAIIDTMTMVEEMAARPKGLRDGDPPIVVFFSAVCGVMMAVVMIVFVVVPAMDAIPERFLFREDGTRPPLIYLNEVWRTQRGCMYVCVHVRMFLRLYVCIRMSVRYVCMLHVRMYNVYAIT